MRLFSALLPPEAVLRRVAEITDELRGLPEAEGLRWTEPTGWHITLAFHGECPDGMLPELGERLGRAAGRSAPFHLRLGPGGRFGDRVLWLGVADADAPPRTPTDTRPGAGIRSPIPGEGGPPPSPVSPGGPPAGAGAGPLTDVIGAARDGTGRDVEGGVSEGGDSDDAASARRTVRGGRAARGSRGEAVGRDRAVVRLAEACRAAGTRAGASHRETTPFRPHLTLARSRGGAGRATAVLAAALEDVVGEAWPVDRLVVIRSELPSGGVPGAGPRYTPLLARELGTGRSVEVPGAGH
ncbi:2'-5' RNA ligase family protein [Streptomyces sp. ST2-7A]|uniref:2'-5' RNA ligase family protein n=1 Tax=Streptomyces sp. ST2-7A TaxID=2907214 RepID=UPI001F3C67A2|nr:2'-5' RNA ligase family protein [Streptomyces sp. ST2-7A]MCE7079068.1 hypothetical protein [Streptomyces sp. ST2-7A]